MSTNFARRHIGPSSESRQKMLDKLGFASLDAFVDAVIPGDIRRDQGMSIGEGLSETEALARLRAMAEKNKVYRSLIGRGYYDCHVPNVIARNVLENPAWYTAYTPYQPEISQGRLEALLNFQTMVSDLTGMEIANASLLDEATAAAEAMLLAQRVSKAKNNTFIVDCRVHPQTLAVIKTRATLLDIDVVVRDCREELDGEYFGVLVQYPDTEGAIDDWKALSENVHARKAVLCVASDLLALTLLTPPGEWGADIVIGNSQRFGVPLGFGGPHAAFMATREAFKRSMPGRLVGVSVDSHGKPAYRLALQTREQHIRREKATSNVCTAQALLAVMAGCYAVYHGPEGLRTIARRVHDLTASLAASLAAAGIKPQHQQFFDTLTLRFEDKVVVDQIIARAVAQGYNLCRADEQTISLSLDERSNQAEVAELLAIITGKDGLQTKDGDCAWPEVLKRSSDFLTHPVFHAHRSETEMMRYLRRLADFDLALDRTMIPLGSCTMKLNAASEMVPLSWPEFSNIHPFAPADQTIGYREMFADLEAMLADATGYAAVSLQPNSGASGEYAGLLAILAYHKSRGDEQRNVCLIPSSAHGTNPASAAMAGMKVVIVACDKHGNIDMDDLLKKVEQHRDELAAIMITYPSTHGVFEHHVRKVCEVVHEAGGQVYLDGANFNAMVGLCAPGQFGSDVSHLNLHKTFAIPHGGGGPGVGPIGVGAHLAEFLPSHELVEMGDMNGAQVSAAPWGSALVTTISWMYMRMMGADGLRDASSMALLNANYIAKRLSEAYQVLYTDKDGHVAHECILDVRPFKDEVGISVDDIAKRLMDFGFHAPTMSFPVPGTLMIEPTESESFAELERFCTAMLTIREEIRKVADGEWTLEDNPLVNAPHTLADLTGDWQHNYDRKTAIFPVEGMNPAKYFTPVNRIDNAYGDRNLVCSCPSIDSYS